LKSVHVMRLTTSNESFFTELMHVLGLGLKDG
jgi:hypothetical protein